MSSYLADGFGNGFGLGINMMQAKKKLIADAKLMQADREFKMSLAEKQIKAAQDEFAAKRGLEIQAAEELKLDPRTQLAKRKAQQEINSLDNPQPPSPEQTLTQNIARLKLQHDFDALSKAPAPASPPMAKIRRNLGADGKGGSVEYELPTTDLEKTLSGANASAYRDPFEEQITGLQTKIAREQSAIEGGDSRSGFLGIGTSRADTVANSQRQLLKLEGLRLQDQVRKGIITQSEADARANQLMGVK